MHLPRPLFVLPFLFAAGCHEGSSNPPAPAAPMVLAAGLETIDPAGQDTISPRVDMQRVELGGLYPRPTRTYQLTTPAGVPFAFDVLTVASGNTGQAQVSISHLLDGTAVPFGGVTSLAAAGVIVNGPGLFVDGRNVLWMGVEGSGFSRLSVRGQIERSQVFAFETLVQQPTGEPGRQTALVELAIGPASAINSDQATGVNHPDIVDDDVVYSSDSWRFAMPAIAVSGDRSSVVVYEGDRGTATGEHRYEMRLQHDRTTGAVTGGGSLAVGLDSGNWRDHEIAALYNVLAVAQGRENDIELRLSFDRGATFAQTEVFAGGAIHMSTRLVQIAMGADYSLALAYWQSDGTRSRLMLVDGSPSAFDTGGSPVAFAFAAPVAIHTVEQHAVPLPMGLQWSQGGDLVIGHAYSYAQMGAWGTTVTEFHCAVRPWQGEFQHLQVDSEFMFARDPSVALRGSGAGLEVYYAYETQTGISLVRIANGQVDYQSLKQVGSRGAYQPSVFAREVSGAVRIDLLYIVDSAFGHELHATRWLAFGASPEEHFRLSTAQMTPTVLTNPQLGQGWHLRHLAWFGYDAVRDGNDIVVVVDEEQFDAQFVFLHAPMRGAVAQTTGGPLSTPTYSPASPPPLAPGMTLPVPPVNPDHRHQLRIVRLQGQ
ncbi:MAG TPA: hypothetical protein VFT55_16830 [Planctomycetota bacterium]|nr:hypothetical protein [Planctomycetota bacterium]